MFKLWLQPDGPSAPQELSLVRTASGQKQEFQAEVSGRRLEVDVETPEPGDGWLRIAGRVYPFVARRGDGNVQVWLQGRTQTVRLVDRRPRRASTTDAAARQSVITAPMPGTVLKVEIAAGETFEAHQPLIVMESMKMEMTLSAPHAGRIKSINCQPRQLVEMGTILARLEEELTQASSPGNPPESSKNR